MAMDSGFGKYYYDYRFVNGNVLPRQDEPMSYPPHMSPCGDPSVELGSRATGYTTNATSPSSVSSDDSDSDAVLKYISQVLLEEDIDQSPCMFLDPLTLQAAEKPFYDVLGQKYPSSPNQHPLSDPEYSTESSSGDLNGGGCPTSSTSGRDIFVSGIASSVDCAWVRGVDDCKSSSSSFVRTSPLKLSREPPPSSQWSVSSTSSALSSISRNSFRGSNPTVPLCSDIFVDQESMKLFQKGSEEGNKFLPKAFNLFINLDNITSTKETTKEAANAVVNLGKGYSSAETSMTRKVRYLHDTDLEEERRSKHSAVSVEDAEELSELFDKVLLTDTGKHEAHCTMDTDSQNSDSLNSSDPCFQSHGLGHNGGTSWANKPENVEKNMVDLRPLLILCAQAVTSDDWRAADEFIKKIRQHSSPTGDGSQRLAHFFVDALAARLAGTGVRLYTTVASERTSASEVIKAYQLFVTCCPFKKNFIAFANNTILKLAQKRDKLHIIDFGILYGFQWPILIQRLSEREGGPPQLRITGIELPQSGFRPAERVVATGHRLARYCEKFNVPFKYHAIAQKWETIKLEDLKIESDELVAVNSPYRMRHLHDESIVVDSPSPRNAVLKLIKDMKPSVFVQDIVNGSFNAPFFITRFREALFHYSMLFDMFHCNVSRDDPNRAMYEKYFFGRDIMNIVACEGTERIERPETYKQWQVRNTRAGFRQLPLDPELMKKLKAKVKSSYHKDFVINVDGNWALQGWKGRIIHAMSVWVPS